MIVQANHFFQSKLLTLRILSSAQMLSGVCLVAGILGCTTTLAMQSISTFLSSIDFIIAMFLGGIPAGTLLIGPFLLVKRLIGDKYKDSNQIFTTALLTMTTINFLFSVGLMALGGVSVSKMMNPVASSAGYYASIICLGSGVIGCFTSLPLMGISLQSQSQTAP